MAQITTITNPLTGLPVQIDQLDHTAQQIDDAISRALPGGAIDTTIGQLKTDVNVLGSRVDEFTALPEGSTSGDAELADIRIGYDGTVYGTAGNAVRAQVTQLKNDLAAVTPDDTAVDGKPWTSKHIVDTLCQPIEKIGNPVQCYPVEGYPLGVTVQIEPLQEGDGIPSPDNVREIAGTDTVSVTHSNDSGISNTYDISMPETVYGGTLDVETGVLTVGMAIVTLDGSESWSIEHAGSATVHFGCGKIANGYVSGSSFLCSHFRSYPISSDWLNNKIFLYATGWCNIKYDNASTADEFKAYLAAQYDAGTPVQICYKLTEPYAIQLTPQQITALSGVNTIYTDADGVIVTGREDPSHTITELKNAIISLGGNI